MKSSFVFAALVAFALFNTALLGAYVLLPAGPENGVTVEQVPISSVTATVSQQTSTSAGPSTLTTNAAALSTVSTATTTTATEASTVTSTATEPAVTASTTTSAATTAPTETATVTSAASSTSATTTGTVSASPSVGYTGALGQSTTSSAGNESFAPAVAPSGGRSGFGLLSLLQFFEIHSIALAPTSWVAVGGMWIWRGRMRSRWTDLGFDSDVFGLFVRMKGGKTRIRLLDALSVPKDRLQLAQELGLDWKGVDRHLMLMKKYGFVDDRVAYGKVRMYQLTPVGRSLMGLLQELSREERRDDAPMQPVLTDNNPPQ